MQVTLDLPEMDLTDQHPGVEPDTGAPLDFPDCGHCGEELSGVVVTVLPFGRVHAEDCLQKLVDNVQQIRPLAAWLAVAQHVAKYPSRHGAATIRSVITELSKPLWKWKREEGK